MRWSLRRGRPESVRKWADCGLAAFRRQLGKTDDRTAARPYKSDGRSRHQLALRFCRAHLALIFSLCSHPRFAGWNRPADDSGL